MLLCAALASVAAPAAPPTLTIVHFKVGNGDSTLLYLSDPSTPSAAKPFTMLIDAGNRTNAAKTVIPGMRQRGIAALDYVIATHHDPDHRDGLGVVLDAVAVSGKGGVYDRDQHWTVDPKDVLKPGWKISVGDLTVRCVAVNGSTEHRKYDGAPLDENAASAAFLITFGKFHYFVGGDLTGGGLQGFSNSADIESHVAGEVGQVDVLRLNHHGSATSSNAAFLKTLNPAAVVISTDQAPLNNQLFLWPARAVLDRLMPLNRLIAIYVTGDVSTGGGLTDDDKKKVKTQQGDIVITTTGEGTFDVNGTSYDLSK